MPPRVAFAPNSPGASRLASSPVAGRPTSPQAYPARTVIAADLATLDEELELLRRFSEEAAPVPEVSMDARLQLHGRFRAEFLSICGRGEHLQAAMPASENRPHRLQALVMHLWTSFVMLREAFLTEMVLLPPPMEKPCLGVVLSAECQAAACRVIGRLLHSRVPNVERQLCAACMRAESLSHELRTAEIYGTSLVSKKQARKNTGEDAEAGRFVGGANISTDPLKLVRKQALRAQEELAKMFPDKGAFDPPKGARMPDASGAGIPAAGENDVDDAHFEFVAVAGKADTTLGFSSTSMPPEPVFVQRVEDGGWAERHGVRPHDELYIVDGEHVEDMTAQQLVEALRRRPLRLTFAREAQTGRKGIGDALLKGEHDDEHGHALLKAPFEVQTDKDDVGHREWLDSASDWFEGVVESARHMIEVIDPDTYAFNPFLNYRDEDDIGMIVGFTDSRLKMGVEGRHTDLTDTRALAALNEQGLDFVDRTDERIQAALELSEGGGWLYEGAGAKVGDVLKNALGRKQTPWPTYPGEQLNSLATSVRREVQGAFLSI